jgi:16S rRNA (cytidine1402-2'-O)-methyltransferase
MSGILYIVATPIGNLDDITIRALEVLRCCDVLAAEDTRRTSKLLERHGISKRMVSLHEHNEERVASGLVNQLKDGKSVALVSDAGTPLLSDPGYRLVRLAGEQGVKVAAVPGPSAITAALSVSGLPTNRFLFEGFMPAKAQQRKKRLEFLAFESRTLVFFEASHRIESFLADLEAVFGPERQAVVCRELTKTFETVKRGTVAELREWVAGDANQRKGEFVVLVKGAQSDSGEHLIKAVEMARALTEFMTTSQAARVAGRICDVSRREIYPFITEPSQD